MEVEKMKKIFVAMMCLSLLTACSQDNKTADKDNNLSNDMNNAVEDIEDTAKSWYGNFENALKDNEISYASKEALDGTSIGAAEGYRYTMDNGQIDVYRYEDGDDFRKIMNDKKLDIDGKSQNVEINDHYVIVSDGLSDNILNIFRNLK
jgi:hypothetical protein